MTGPPEVIQPNFWKREASVPPLGLIPASAFRLEDLLRIKRQEQIPVYLVFPAGTAREAGNLNQLLSILEPLAGELIDQSWIAFGGKRPGNLRRLAEAFPWVRLFSAHLSLPPDQQQGPLGKGAVMRALIYHLVVRERLNHPRAVICFIDSDIRPPYFHPRWVVGMVGAILWFRTVEAAKVVYYRPRGGRLNAMVRSLLALCPHDGVQALQKLVYLLSGEMAGTLKFWISLPFKSGYGVETLTLLSLALNQLHLAPDTPDLDHVVQVHVGQMDHRHAPLTSTPKQKGLDQMAASVFHTLFEVFTQAEILKWRRAFPENLRLRIPSPIEKGMETPEWLEVFVGDLTLPPLRTCPEVLAVLGERGC